MKTIYQLIILLLLIGCSADIPNEQQNFIDEWKRIKEGYNNANTSSSKQRFKDTGYTFLKENKSKVTKWYGKVIDVTASNRVVVKHEGVEYTLKPRGEYAPSLNKLKKGDKTLFSGNLEGESSFTTAGAIDKPEMIAIIDKLTNIDSSNTFYEYIPSPKELSDSWFKYSKGKLRKELGSIMRQTDSDGNKVYPYAAKYTWDEKVGYTSASGALYYYSNGNGDAEMWAATGSSASESGSWKIQWAPAVNSSPLNSDIIFTIDDGSGKFSHHIGSDNKLWTPMEEFLKNNFRTNDADRMMYFADSLRKTFMKENNCSIGNDGRFKIADKLKDISDNQKVLLRKIDKMEKSIQTLSSADQKKQSNKKEPPKVDPNKVYNIPIGDSFTKGPDDAAVTIIEWSDFQSSHCARAVSLIDDILKKYPNDVRVVVKQFPLAFHKQAKKASLYVLAAERQGKYQEMSDKIFANYSNLKFNEDLPRQYAEKLGLDMVKFDKDMKDPALEARIDKEVNQMKQSGIPRMSVPKFLINGKEPQGSRNLESYSGIIDAELKKKK